MTETIFIHDPAAFDAEPPAFDPAAPDADLLVAHMVRRLRALEAKQQRARRIAAAEQAEIARWLDSQLAPITNEAENLRRVVESYALAVLERSGGRTKSVSFPAGTVKTRTAEHWDWPADTADLLAELDDTDMVRITKAIDKTAVKRNADVTPDGAVVLRGLGVVLPGVHVETRTTVTVTTTGEPEWADDDEVEA